MFYPIAGSKFYIGTNIYAMKNTPFVQNDFVPDTFNLLNEVQGFDPMPVGSSPVEFNAIWPSFKRRAKGPRDFGTMAVQYASDTTDLQQVQLQAMEQSQSDYAFKLIFNDAPPVPVVGTATITIAAPGVVTLAGHGLTVGSRVSFATTLALPTGIVAGTPYYVASVTTNTFQLHATLAAALAGTSPITTSGTQSGVHTLTSAPQPSVRYFIGKVMSVADSNGKAEDIMMREAVIAINCQPVTVNATP